MAKNLIIFCEICGSDTLSCTTDFIVFHHLSFCSPDCHDAYRSADEARLTGKEKAAGAPKAKAA